jgi:hypothetical protein
MSLAGDVQTERLPTQHLRQQLDPTDGKVRPRPEGSPTEPAGAAYRRVTPVRSQRRRSGDRYHHRPAIRCLGQMNSSWAPSVISMKSEALMIASTPSYRSSSVRWFMSADMRHAHR